MTLTDIEQSPTPVDGLLVLQTRQFDDDRGSIHEMYRQSAVSRLAGGPAAIKQVNLTYSKHGTIRGLHGEAMSKLVGLATGEAFGAYLDARPDSPTRGKLATVSLRPGTQVLVPAGVCNGFQALAPEGCLYLYCFDTEWAADITGVFVNPLDPAVGVPWPIAIDAADRSRLSAKDASHPTFAEAMADLDIAHA
ncbi:MAG TPA: dTDP-4-dehydrorhamnose 3,5-epimerase [Acidimicrobiales bacterium]|jgi:dTDP-4-dehydrorhamnose 3,5-epimerase|nr:dTDP-4-dehydrorhamnose 3,5-epimerase [Acidimicrobiales bacterium]